MEIIGIVEAGNTRTKIYIYDDECVKEVASFNSEEIEPIYASVSRCDAIILSSSGDASGLSAYLKNHVRGKKLFILDDDLKGSIKHPFECGYDMTALGWDRIANIYGAYSTLDAQSHGLQDYVVLVVDLGTAITLDAVSIKSDGAFKYLGGNISPGMRLRFESLHDHTHALPLFTSREASMLYDTRDIIGHDTARAICNGVLGGVMAEIQMLYFSLQKACHCEAVEVILTGGDAEYISRFVDVPHTIDKKLQALGLLKIYELNR